MGKEEGKVEKGKIVLEDLCYLLILDFQHPAREETDSVAWATQ